PPSLLVLPPPFSSSSLLILPPSSSLPFLPLISAPLLPPSARLVTDRGASQELPPSPIGGGQDRRQGPGSPRRAPRHELRAAAEGRLDRAEGLGLQARLRTHAPVQRHALGRGPCAGLPPSPPRAPEERRGPAVCQARAEEHGYGAFGFVVGKRSGWKTCCYKNFSVEEVLDDLIEDGQVTLYYNGERSLGDAAIARAASIARNLSAARRASGAAWQPGDPPPNDEL
ncbi:unnamed protein product, partial [Prorocentrum cordatum]